MFYILIYTNINYSIFNVDHTKFMHTPLLGTFIITWYLHDLFSPGDSPTSQNKIFGFVDRTTCPLSDKHGANDVSEFPINFSSLVTDMSEGKLMLLLVKHKQFI